MKTICEWKNCNNVGEFKAPVEKDNSKKHKMLCLEHIKEFNKNWNYFAGMSDQQVLDFIKSDMLWHKPTQNFNSPDNFSIEVYLKSKRIELRPIEKLFLYDRILKRKYKKNNIIKPSLKKVLNEFRSSDLKPGFELQYENFKRFIKNRTYNGIKITEAKEITSICQKILN